MSNTSWKPTLSNRVSLLLFAPLIVLLFGFVLYPLVRLSLISVTTGEGLRNYLIVLQSSAGQRSLVVTLAASGIVTICSVGCGALLAWHLVTSRSKLGRGILWLGVFIPFWMGTVVKNYAIILLIARNGPINRFLATIGAGRMELLYTSSAVVVGMVYTMIPYAVFSLYGVFRTIDPSLPLAARSLGASRVRAITTVVLPLSAPGLVASSALVFSISLGFFVTPVLLGGAQVPFMATYVEDFVLRHFNLPVASAASVILLASAAIVLGVALRIVGRERLVRALG